MTACQTDFSSRDKETDVELQVTTADGTEVVRGDAVLVLDAEDAS
jgi:hypothetical protein